MAAVELVKSAEGETELVECAVSGAMLVEVAGPVALSSNGVLDWPCTDLPAEIDKPRILLSKDWTANSTVEPL